MKHHPGKYTDADLTAAMASPNFSFKQKLEFWQEILRRKQGA